MAMIREYWFNLVYFFGVTALYGYSIWLPSIIESFTNVNAASARVVYVIMCKYKLSCY